VAFLSGITSVKEAMDNAVVSSFIKNLMTEEIAKAIPYNLPQADAQAFAAKVLDRFRNPNIEHHWINITLNFTQKLEMRIVPVLQHYAELYNAIPENMALGFAAYIVFMHPVKKEYNMYYGIANGKDYPIKDVKADYFYEQWNNFAPKQLVLNVLSNAALWNTDLSVIPGLTEKVTENVEDILKYGMEEVLQNATVKI
jgi:tagaturonate reductase